MYYTAGYSYFNDNNCFHEKCLNCSQTNENDISQKWACGTEESDRI